MTRILKIGLCATVVSALAISLYAGDFPPPRGPHGSGHAPRGPGRAPSPAPPRWGGWGSGGRALFWTDFGLEIGKLVHGTVVTYLPPERTVVYIAGTPYYYYAGTYFAVVHNGAYVVVNPPSAIVQPVPSTTVVVQQQGSSTASVSATAQTAQKGVSQPAVQAAADQDQEKSSSSAVSDSSKYDVYLNNGNGTFTVVPLVKTASGFLGPQGEFYQDHPTLEQLTERYLRE